jgi:thioredoxin 1
VSEVTLDTKNFEEEVLNAQKLVLVDFWAPWCGPCQQLGPVIEELATELEQENRAVKVGKLNVDQNREIAAEYGIQGIPTVILFQNGEETARFVGSKPKDFYRKEIYKLLEPAE